MADELQRWIEQMPDRVERQIARDFGAAVDDELVSPIRDAARRGKSGNLAASVHKEAGKDNLSWVVAAGGTLTTKEIRKGSYVDYDYALGEEFGNSHAPGRPFFWPTIRARLGRLRQRAYDIAADAIGNL